MWPIVPVPDPPLDTAMPECNLFGRFSYRAFENPADSVEMATLGYVQSLAVSYATLAAAYFRARDATAAQRVCAQMFERLRFDTWLSEAPLVTDIQKKCEREEQDASQSNAGE